MRNRDNKNNKTGGIEEAAHNHLQDKRKPIHNANITQKNRESGENLKAM